MYSQKPMRSGVKMYHFLSQTVLASVSAYCWKMKENTGILYTCLMCLQNVKSQDKERYEVCRAHCGPTNGYWGARRPEAILLILSSHFQFGKSPMPPLRWLTMLFFALQTNLLLTWPLCSPSSSSDVSRLDRPKRSGSSNKNHHGLRYWGL